MFQGFKKHFCLAMAIVMAMGVFPIPVQGDNYAPFDERYAVAHYGVTNFGYIVPLLDEATTVSVETAIVPDVETIVPEATIVSIPELDVVTVVAPDAGDFGGVSTGDDRIATVVVVEARSEITVTVTVTATGLRVSVEVDGDDANFTVTVQIFVQVEVSANPDDYVLVPIDVDVVVVDGEGSADISFAEIATRTNAWLDTDAGRTAIIDALVTDTFTLAMLLDSTINTEITGEVTVAVLPAAVDDVPLADAASAVAAYMATFAAGSWTNLGALFTRLGALIGNNTIQSHTLAVAGTFGTTAPYDPSFVLAGNIVLSDGTATETVTLTDVAITIGGGVAEIPPQMLNHVVGNIAGGATIALATDVNPLRVFAVDPDMTGAFWNIPAVQPARGRLGRTLEDIYLSN